MKKTVDYLKLDLEAGKPYMARVQEELHRKRIEDIRRKHWAQRRALVVAFLMAASLTDSSAQGMRQFCDIGGTCFVCQRGLPTCEASYALSRMFTPPGTMPNLSRVLPPSPSPSPGPLYPERYPRYAPPPPPALTMEQDRERVIREGEEHCRRWPHDQICHPLPPDAPPPQ